MVLPDEGSTVLQPSLDSGESVVVCPTAYSARMPPDQQPGLGLNLRIAQAAKPWDHLTVELIGLIAAAVVAATRISKTVGLQKPPTYLSCSLS